MVTLKAEFAEGQPRTGAGTADPEDDTAALHTAIEQLQQAISSHAIIDQAIGVLIVLAKTSPEESWDLLREVSMNANVKVRHVAELLVTGARTGHIDASIREPLRARMTTAAHERPRSK